MADAQETIADIIAKMRQGMNPNGTAECQYLESDICMLADRLEAAHKRELSKNTSKNGADFGQLGDCAKLRKAALRQKELLQTIYSRGSVDRRELCAGMGLIDAALAAPPRNCDVGTAEELYERYEKFCCSHFNNEDDNCLKCPFSQPTCKFAWAQMPYEEGGDK